MRKHALDDLALTKQNQILFDNFNNYNKPSVDYFSYQPSTDMNSIYCKFFSILNNYKYNVHNKKIRLPSCSIDDSLDYTIYLKRLVNCVFRKWSMYLFKINNKFDPLDINWNKVSDFTVLYGPDLTISDFKYIDFVNEQDTNLTSLIINENFIDYRSEIYRSTSITSTKSNLSNCSNKSLQFDDTVLRRDIDRKGKCFEFKIMINDYEPILS